MRIDPQAVMQQVTQLLLVYPELGEDEILRADMIEGETDLNELLRSIVRKRQDAVQMVAAIKGSQDDLAARKARYERRDEAMRELAFKLMQHAELPKCELPEATLSIRNGTRKVIVTNEVMIPTACTKITRTPDKTKIKAMLESGQTVPGAELSNAEPSITIRVK